MRDTLVVLVKFKPFYPLLCALLSMFAAQFIKSLLCLIKDRKIDFKKWFSSGGMPSSHSAMVTSLSTAVGFQEGFESALFSMSVVFSLIVLYDAAGVRQMVGKQAILLNQMLSDVKDGHQFKFNKVNEFLGHTPMEVFAGSVLGISIAYLFWI